MGMMAGAKVWMAGAKGRRVGVPGMGVEKVMAKTHGPREKTAGMIGMAGVRAKTMAWVKARKAGMLMGKVKIVCTITLGMMLAKGKDGPSGEKAKTHKIIWAETALLGRGMKT